MKYIRLSKEVRYKVARQIVDNKFWPRIEEVRKNRSAYALTLAKKYVPKEVLELVDKFPEFIEKSSYIYFKAYNEEVKRFDSTMESINYYKDAGCPTMKYIEISRDEFKKFKDYSQEERRVSDERSSFMHNLLRVSDTLNSYKKYVEALPEFKPELDHVLGLEDKQEETEQKELEKFRESLKE